MIIKLILFILFSSGLYYFAEPLYMKIFGRTCSSIYCSYAFLMTFPLLFVFAIMRKGLLHFIIYLGVPLLGIVFSLYSYSLLKMNLMTTDIFLFPVILKSTY
jgi:hypothetical protein